MGSLYQPGMFLSSKKRKDKSVTFRLENKVLESLAAYLYNQTEGSRGHTHRDLLVQENTQRPLRSIASGCICARCCAVGQDSAGMTGRSLAFGGHSVLTSP